MLTSNLNVANRKCVQLLANSDRFSYLTASQLGSGDSVALHNV